MPFAEAEGARLYYEEAGSGYPLVFVHEFAGDYRCWEQQMRDFSRSYRCIAFNARGYPPSDVPADPSLYGQEFAADDIAAVIRHLGLPRAHVVGLSQGASAALHFGMRHAELVSALVLAGCGSGAPKADRERFQRESRAKADQLENEGIDKIAADMALAPNRVQLQNKDPRGFTEFVKQLAEHSSAGSAMTLRRYQAMRPSLYDLSHEIAAIASPTLILVGDEDEPCLEPSLFLKRTMASAGLWVFPKTGHAMNLEEPALFNQVVRSFLAAVELGKWMPRDPRSRATAMFTAAKAEKAV